MTLWLAWLLVGCGQDHADSAVDAEVARVVLAAGPVARPGGHWWLAGVGRVDSLAVELLVGEETWDLEQAALGGDRGFALYAVPEVPVGVAVVRVHDGAREQRVPVEIVQPTWEDVAPAMGLDVAHRVEGWPEDCAESLTAVGFADVDGDGDLDAFVGDLLGDSVLLRNDGDLDGDDLPDFVDATEALGLEGQDLVTAVTFVDLDDDGDLDLLLGRRGPNRLLENRHIPDGEPGFVDASEAWGLPQHPARTTGFAPGDFDSDGDLDLYVLNHAWCYPTADPAVDHLNGDQLLRNDGGTLVDVTALLPDPDGQVSDRFGFGALWVDGDDDGDLDLFVFNDEIVPGRGGVHWRNDGLGDDGWRFVDVTDASGFWPSPDALGKGINAMAATVGDLNGDGRPDFATSNIGPNVLLVSQPDGTWADEAERAGVVRALTPWEAMSITWGAHLFDADNDGDLDLFYVGGALKGDGPQPHAFFENLGARFVDRTWEAGLEDPGHGKASALVDLDSDGHFEIVVMTWGGRVAVYRMREPSGNGWLRVALVGDGVVVPRQPFGAVVTATTPDGTQTCFHNPMPSLSSTGDPTCHFGLGARREAEVVVQWPDGLIEPLGVRPAGRLEVHRAP